MNLINVEIKNKKHKNKNNLMENKYEIDDQESKMLFLNFIFHKFNNNILVKYW